MPFSIDDPVMMREIIMDNYQNPRNKVTTNDPSYTTIHMDSASCIDDIYIQVKVVDSRIVDCLWHGTGCAISSASTSIMTERVKGMTIPEALAAMKNFNDMLEGKNFDEEELGEDIAFRNVNRQPSRITCANISWRGLKKALDSRDGKKEEGK
jgi:nitrogen fixation NifU-like protein